MHKLFAQPYHQLHSPPLSDQEGRMKGWTRRHSNKKQLGLVCTLKSFPWNHIYLLIYLLIYCLFYPLLSLRFCSETASFMQTSKRKRTSTSLSSIIHAPALTLHCNRKSVIFPLLKQGLTSSLMANPNLVRMPVSRWRITVKHVSHTRSLNEMSLPQSCLFALFSPRVTATATLILNHCR